MKTEIYFKTSDRILVHNIHRVMQTHYSNCMYSLFNLNEFGISDCALKIEAPCESTLNEVRDHVKKLIDSFN